MVPFIFILSCLSIETIEWSIQAPLYSFNNFIKIECSKYCIEEINMSTFVLDLIKQSFCEILGGKKRDGCIFKRKILITLKNVKCSQNVAHPKKTAAAAGYSFLRN